MTRTRKKKPLTKTEEAWMYFVFAMTGFIWLWDGWKYALSFFLTVCIFAQVRKFFKNL